MICDAVFIGLGSNLGERLENITHALNQIQHLSKTDIVDFSSIYETAPVGYGPQRQFFNQVARLQTGLDPGKLLTECMRIERHLGRKRRVKWGPRTLDVDLLFWDDKVIDTKELTVPHPHVASRRFVLEPLCEIAPTFVTPLNQKTVRDLLAACQDKNAVTLHLSREDFAFK